MNILRMAQDTYEVILSLLR